MDTHPLHVLLVDDEAIVHQSVGRFLRKCGHTVTSALSACDAMEAVEAHRFDVAVLDVRMPEMDGLTLLEKLTAEHPDLPCIVCTGHADIDMAITALRGGASDFIRKPISLQELQAVMERVMRLTRMREENRRLRSTMKGLRTAARLRSGGLELIGESDGMRHVREQIALAVDAQCDTLLITGETGSGKEVVARVLHDRSIRCDGPFIPLNCPAIPESMIESELFGHTRGSFTGATEHREGYFEMADQGTLFLDEIADLPMAAQAAILRVVETRRVRRIGGGNEKELDLCLMVASNQDLQALAAERAFRQDLYYRLNVFAIHVPPLRERREDVRLLSHHFLKRFRSGRKIPAEDFSGKAMAALEAYNYPGNVRELRNLVERAAIVCRERTIGPEHLEFRPAAAPATGDSEARVAPEPDEKARIEAALRETRWNRRKAAELLHMSYSTLREKIARYAIR